MNNNTLGIEQSIMNNLLHNPDLLGKLRVTPEMFTEPDVIAFIEHVIEVNKVDKDEVANYFAKHDKLSLDRMMKVYNNLGTGKEFFMDDQRELLEQYKARESARITQEYLQGQDATQLPYMTEQLENLQKLSIKKDNPTRSFLDEFVGGILDGEPKSFIKTGIPAIDDRIFGFEEGQLNVMAGRPSTGKTALSLTMFMNIAKQGYPCTYFSLETGGSNITERLTAMMAGVELTEVKKRSSLSDQQVEKLIKSAGDIDNSGVTIVDDAVITPNDIRAVAMEKSDKPHVIFIDYLTLMHPNTPNKDRRLEVESISRDLKIIAKECNCVIFALSQLNRGVEGRQDKRPMMSDIRDAGGVEQDANMIFMLYRDDYYDKTLEDESGKSDIEFIVAKNKDGETGTVPLEFYKKTQRFF